MDDEQRSMTPAELKDFEEKYWAEHALHLGRWLIHPGTGHVFFEGQKVATLSMMDEELLLMVWRAYPLSVKPVEMVRDWGMDIQSVKVYVRRIRLKLGPAIIEAKDGRGYRFNPDAVWMGGG